MDVPNSWRRLTAHFIDSLVLSALCYPVFSQMMHAWETQGEVSVHWALALYFIIARISYDVLSVYFFQGGLGKKIMHLCVVDNRNVHRPLSLAQCLLRAFGQRLSFFFSYAPQALALNRHDRTHLVDWLADTRVAQKTPGLSRVKVYPIWVAVLVLYFVFQGLAVANSQISQMDWEKPNLILSPEWIPLQSEFED
ncbi:MAG: RDD family protein [Bdellovibrionota bacterium]